MHGATGFIEVPATELTEKLASRLHTLVTSSAVQPPKSKEVQKQPPARPALVARPVPPPETVEKSREESVLDVIVAKNRVKEDEIENAQKRRLQVLVDKMNQRSEKERRKKEKKRLEKEKAKASGDSAASKKAVPSAEVASKSSVGEKAALPAGGSGGSSASAEKDGEKESKEKSVEIVAEESTGVKESAMSSDVVKLEETAMSSNVVKSEETAKPVDSANPSTTAEPELPKQPVEPSDSVQSLDSKSEASKPLDSVPLSGSVDLEQSSHPLKEEEPTKSVGLEQSSHSVKAKESSKPEEVSQSSQSAKEEEPVKPSLDSDKTIEPTPSTKTEPTPSDSVPTPNPDSTNSSNPTKAANSKTEKDTMSPLTVTPSVISVLEGSSALNLSSQSNAQTTPKTKRLFDTDRSSLGESSSIFSSLSETKKPVSRASHPKTGKKSRSTTPAKSHKESSRSTTPAKPFRESSRNSQKPRATQSMMSVDAAAYVRPDSPKNVVPSQEIGEDASQPLRLDSNLFLPQNYDNGVLDDTGYGLHDLDWRMDGRYANPSMQQPYMYDSGGFSYGFSNPYRRMQDYRAGQFDRNLDRRFFNEYSMPSFMDYYDTMPRGSPSQGYPGVYRDPLLPVDAPNDFWEGSNLDSGNPRAHRFMDNDDVLADDYEDTPLNLRDPDSLVFPESRSSSVTLRPHAPDLPPTNRSGCEPVM